MGLINILLEIIVVLGGIFSALIVISLLLLGLIERLAERRKRNIERKECMRKEQMEKEAEANRKEFLARLYAKRNK